MCSAAELAVRDRHLAETADLAVAVAGEFVARCGDPARAVGLFAAWLREEAEAGQLGCGDVANLAGALAVRAYGAAGVGVVGEG